MSAMHPESGVPPEDARNSIPNEVEASVNCDELWYSTSRCQPRFDPAAANAMLAELINLINKGEVVYDCSRYDQVQFAVRYLIQRGLTKGAVLQAGPNNYVTTLDPTMTRYNDLMVLCVVPKLGNAGAVLLDIDGRGNKKVVRNDGLDLVKADWLPGVPYPIGFWNDRWWMLCMVASQVPKMGHVITWIRTDGSDITGDGTENKPEKAYRTINGAWAAVATNYVATPSTSINFILGCPGVYEGGIIANFTGNVSLTSVDHNRSTYIIATSTGALGSSIASMNANLAISDVTLRLNGGAGAVCAASGYNGNMILTNVACEVVSGSPSGAVFGLFNGGRMTFLGITDVYGVGQQSIGYVWIVQQRAGYEGSGGGGNVLQIRNLTATNAVASVTELSLFSFAATSVIESSVLGPEYSISENSVYKAFGQAIPGSTPGTAATGAQFVP